MANAKETVSSQNVAYVRVSTVEQNEGRQLEALKKYNIDKYFIEKVSGKSADREQLKVMLDYVREGDTIYIESFSRLARNTMDLLSLVTDLTEKGIQLYSLKENIDTRTASGKLMLTVLGGIATFERDIMLERQREGIALAKAEGKYKGRVAKEQPEQWIEWYQLYKTRQITAKELAERCKVSRTLLYRWIGSEA